jgi:hypothetical protein
MAEIPVPIATQPRVEVEKLLIGIGFFLRLAEPKASRPLERRAGGKLLVDLLFWRSHKLHPPGLQIERLHHPAMIEPGSAMALQTSGLAFGSSIP